MWACKQHYYAHSPDKDYSWSSSKMFYWEKCSVTSPYQVLSTLALPQVSQHGKPPFKGMAHAFPSPRNSSPHSLPSPLQSSWHPTLHQTGFKSPNPGDLIHLSILILIHPHFNPPLKNIQEYTADHSLFLKDSSSLQYHTNFKVSSTHWLLLLISFTGLSSVLGFFSSLSSLSPKWSHSSVPMN